MERFFGSIARPTAQRAPWRRSIQITISSRVPSSPTPWKTRSANRVPAGSYGTDARIQSSRVRDRGARTEEARVLLAHLRRRRRLRPAQVAHEDGFPRGVRHPRAPLRPPAPGDPGRSVSEEPRDRRAAPPLARPARRHSRRRLRRRQHDGRAGPRELELGPNSPLARPVENESANGEILGRDAEALEEDDVVVLGAALHLAADDLGELVHLQPVEHPALDRLDEIARLDLRLLLRVAAHERSALEDRVVELTRLDAVRAHGADERAGLQP